MEYQDDQYPEILAHLRDEAADVLAGVGLDEGQAMETAFAISERIRKKWGGLAFYIPKGMGWDLTRRDYEIYERFKGSNKKDLCREFSISEQRLYQIIARIRSERQEQRQLPIF